MKTIYRRAALPMSGSRALAAVGLFALALSGAAARLMAQTSINDISVKNYGATGNGVTDDTAAFQNAIAAAQSLNQNGVYVPMGKYVIKASLTLNGLEMLGKFAGGWPADSLPMPTLLLRHYTEPGLILQDGASVHGIALDYDSGSPSNSIAPAISLQGQGVTLSSLRIQAPYDAITTPSTNTPSRARFSDIFIVQPQNVGVQISKAYDFVQFHHIEVWCNSHLPTGSAFRFGHIDGGTFNGLVSYQVPTGVEIYTDTDPGGGTFTGSLLDCCSDQASTGVSVTGDHTVNITAGDWDCNSYGAVINGTNAQVTITGGKWHVNAAQGVKITQGANVMLNACMFYRSSSASATFVWAANCTTVTVNACQFLPGSTGLLLDSTVQRAVITANSFEAGSIINNMTSNKQIISNNLLP
jgi:hypothetical protein